MGGRGRPRSLWRASYAGLTPGREGLRVAAQHENEQAEDEAGRGAEDAPAGHPGRGLDQLADEEPGQGAERERQEEAGPVAARRQHGPDYRASARTQRRFNTACAPFYGTLVLVLTSVEWAIEGAGGLAEHPAHDRHDTLSPRLPSRDALGVLPRRRVPGRRRAGGD